MFQYFDVAINQRGSWYASQRCHPSISFEVFPPRLCAGENTNKKFLLKEQKAEHFVTLVKTCALLLCQYSAGQIYIWWWIPAWPDIAIVISSPSETPRLYVWVKNIYAVADTFVIFVLLTTNRAPTFYICVTFPRCRPALLAKSLLSRLTPIIRNPMFCFRAILRRVS